MTTSADAYTFDFSTNLKNNQPVYISKQWGYQNDQNNQAYQSKQIYLDLTGFYNSARFINPQEMIIVLPVVCTMSAVRGPTTAGTSTVLPQIPGVGDGLGAPPSQYVGADGSPAFNVSATGNWSGVCNDMAITNQFAFGFKSGYWNLIHSMQIQVDGKGLAYFVLF